MKNQLRFDEIIIEVTHRTISIMRLTTPTMTLSNLPTRRSFEVKGPEGTQNLPAEKPTPAPTPAPTQTR